MRLKTKYAKLKNFPEIHFWSREPHTYTFSQELNEVQLGYSTGVQEHCRMRRSGECSESGDEPKQGQCSKHKLDVQKFINLRGRAKTNRKNSYGKFFMIVHHWFSEKLTT